MKGEIIKPVRLGKDLIEKLKKIIEQEEQRGHTKVSFATAGEILSKRIDDAGGLREWDVTNCYFLVTIIYKYLSLVKKDGDV